MPYYIEWILSFPKAPLGSISVQTWWIACACVILLVGDAITAGYALIVGQAEARTGADTQKEKAGREKMPMAFEADGAGREEKKEL